MTTSLDQSTSPQTAQELRLGARAFAALVGETGAMSPLGLAVAEEALPKATRRRLSTFDMAVARCTFGVLEEGRAEDIVFASRYGNMLLTYDLLVQLAEQELLSPAKFSMSVHNAASGAVSLLAANIGLMRGLGVLTYDCEGVEALRSMRGVVVVANHPSLIDVIFLMSFMSHTRAVVKAGVWRNPFMHGVVAAADYIPNLGEAEKLVEACSQALKERANLVIFPEGSRTPPGVRRRYQKGFARAALAAGAPVHIVTITVDPPTLLKGESWRNIPKRRPHWTIRVHERIDTLGQYGYDREPATVRRFSTDVANRIEGHLRT